MNENYNIKNRVEVIINEQGSVSDAIVFIENELEECESLWGMFSSDCLGHAITFYRLALNYIKTL